MFLNKIAQDGAQYFDSERNGGRASLFLHETTPDGVRHFASKRNGGRASLLPPNSAGLGAAFSPNEMADSLLRFYTKERRTGRRIVSRNKIFVWRPSEKEVEATLASKIIEIIIEPRSISERVLTNKAVAKRKQPMNLCRNNKLHQ